MTRPQGITIAVIFIAAALCNVATVVMLLVAANRRAHRVVPARPSTSAPRVPVDGASRNFVRPVISATPSPNTAQTDHRSEPAARTHASPSLPGLAAAIRWCESRDNYTAQNKQTTASGAYQFLDTTWQHLTGLPGHARDYPPAVQDHAFLDMYAAAGTRPWASSRPCWSHK